MKKYFILLIMVALISIGVNAEIYSISPTLINQDPDPVEPGEYVDLRWKIENIGSGIAENVTIEIMPEYPFSLDPGVSAQKNIGQLQGLQSDDEAVIVKYRLRVNENAVEGDNPVQLRYRNKHEFWSKKEFYISVEPVDLTVFIENVKNTPETLAPGKEATIDITVKNLGESLIKDLSLLLDLGLSTLTESQASIVAAGSSTGSIDLVLPFAPIKSATEKKIQSLKPGASYTFSYNVLTYPDAESKIYRIPIQLQYRDEQGNEYSRNDMIGAVVGKEPELSVWLETTDIDSTGQSGEVTIKLVNKDVTDIKFLTVTLVQGADYTIKSSPEVYLGNVDSDDYESADFDIYVKPNAPSTIVLPLKIEYKDANNNDYLMDKDIEIKLYTTEELKAMGDVAGNNTTGIIIIVFVVILGYIFYRWRKKKHQK